MGDLVVSQIRKFIEWLSFHPSSDDIARALATDFLKEFGVLAVRFGQMNSDDSATVLGQYGYADADQWRNRVIPSAEWRSMNTPTVDIITGKNKDRWSPDSKICVVVLRDRGVIQGHVKVEFTEPVASSEKSRVLEAIEDYCVPIALYLSLQNNNRGTNVSGINVINDSRDSGAGQLSARQLSILRGMVEGKTNHELATEMGFSVSTIRHETMRIYQALAVSDRKEAAKKALMLSLI
jgi:DNA-binding CsgD family transcriptional regulator